MNKEKWLVLSHAFNMDGRAASQTITDKIPFFAEHGIVPIVLSAVTGIKDRHIPHQQLLPWGPAGLRFDLRHYFRSHIGLGVRYRLLMLLLSCALAPFILLEKLLFGLQSQWSWALAATARGLLVIWKEKPTFIYSTGGAYSAHLAGYWLKKITKLSWAAEIHDPMVVSGEKQRTRDEKFQAWLESKICQDADSVWWFTETALERAAARNPLLGMKGFFVLPGATPPQVRAAYRRGDQCVFAHFGSLGSTRSLLPFVKGLREWLNKHPDSTGLVRVEVYGSALDNESRKFIAEHSLEGYFEVFGRLEFSPETGLSGRERVVGRMQEVDCLLLMHGEIKNCAEYIPSKLYEYFWARRPVFAITHNNPFLDNLVLSKDGFVADVSDQCDIVQKIECIFTKWFSNSLMCGAGVTPVGVSDAFEVVVSRVRQSKMKDPF